MSFLCISILAIPAILAILAISFLSLRAIARCMVHQCNQWFRRCFPDCHLMCFPVKLKVTVSFPYMLKTAFKRRFCALLFFCLAAAAAAPQDTPSLPSAASEFAHLILSREGPP